MKLSYIFLLSVFIPIHAYAMESGSDEDNHLKRERSPSPSSEEKLFKKSKIDNAVVIDLREKTDNVTNVLCSTGAVEQESEEIQDLANKQPDSSPSMEDQEEQDSIAFKHCMMRSIDTKNLFMFRVTFPYPGKEYFREISESLFNNSSLLALKQTDLMLDAYSGPFDLSFARITAIQYLSGENVIIDYKNLKAFIKNSMGNFIDKKEIIKEKYFDSEAFNNVTSGNDILCKSPDPTIDSNKTRKLINGDYAIYNGTEEFLPNFLDNKGKGSYRLQVTRNNKLEVTSYIYTPKLIEDEEKEFFGWDISVIKDFKGKIYQKNDWFYNKKIKQYATSSYLNEEENMTPFMIAYPLDEEDIKAAIEHAEKDNKNIVARSGGHHYTGKSSGGQKTIVLSMDNFTKLEMLDDTKIEVGPGVRLTNLSNKLMENKITIPHGECPQVAIGGHAQTGGYGHFARSFGLTLDYVQAFDIILADGKKRTITRPEHHSSNEEDKLNQEIFRGVLGGNAGSFGIITKYIFNCIKDKDHPNSYGYKLTRNYDTHVFTNLMGEAKKWTESIQNNDENHLKGLDFMMTVESNPLGHSFPFSLLLVELVYSDLDKTPYEEQFKSIINIAEKNMGGLKALTEGKKALSKLSDSFVRRWPSTTREGREFDYPYKKRVNCTMESLTQEFINNLVYKINEVEKTPGVNLVFQMTFGGGAYKSKGNERVGATTITSIPHRNYVYCFVFDLFYENEKASELASEFQKDMQLIVDNHFNNDKERRVFWGTFGDTNIRDQTIRNMYYDNEEQYTEMQDLKKKIDPKNIFSTELTVQLPPQVDNHPI